MLGNTTFKGILVTRDHKAKSPVRFTVLSAINVIVVVFRLAQD